MVTLFHIPVLVAAIRVGLLGCHALMIEQTPVPVSFDLDFHHVLLMIVNQFQEPLRPSHSVGCHALNLVSAAKDAESDVIESVAVTIVDFE